MSEKKGVHPAWKMFVAGCLLVAGGQGFVFNIFGIFIVPITTTLGFNVGILSTAMAAGAATMMVGMFFVGKVMAKIKLRTLLIICAIGMSGAFVLMSQFREPWMFYISIPLYNLFGAIPCFIAGPMLITNWFEKRRGLTMGLMMCCGNVGAIIGSMLGGIIIENSGYEMAFIVTGIISFALCIIGALLAVAHPAMVGLTAYGASEGGSSEAAVLEGVEAGAGEASVAIGIAAKDAYRSLAFYLVFITVLLLISASMFTVFISPLGSTLGLSPIQAASLVGIFQLGSLVGALLIGIINDKIGVRNCCFICFAVLTLAILSIYFLGTNQIVLYIALAAFGFSAAAGGQQPAMITGRLFGLKDYPGILSKMTMAQSLAGLVALPTYGLLFDATGSFDSALIAISVIGILCIFFVALAFASGAKLWQKKVGTAMSK